MSYSFSFKAATKEEAKQKAAAEFDKVVESMTLHIRDRDAALAAAGAFIDLLADDDSQDVQVSVNGSVGWRAALDPGGEATVPLTASAVGVSVYLSHREQQPA